MLIDIIEIEQNATYAVNTFTPPVTIDNPPAIDCDDVPLMDMAALATGHYLSGNAAVPSRAVFAS